MLRFVALVTLITSTALVPLLESNGFNFPSSTKSYPKIPESIKVAYYPVLQATPAGLKHAVATHGPLDLFGVRRAALFSWKINWHWVEVQPGKIDLKLSQFRADYRLTLPTVLSEPLTAAEQARWDGYLSGLITHELSHYLNADQCAGEIGLALDRMALRARVAEKAAVFKAVTEVLKECSRRDLAFDSETNHGLLSGAVLGK